MSSEMTALTSLTRLSAQDWSYILHASDWRNLGALPHLQVLSCAACCDWPPSVATLPALTHLTCRVGYRPLMPELLLPLLLRAVPALQQLEVVLEDPPLPHMRQVCPALCHDVRHNREGSSTSLLGCGA
jgi:hypothetical protein